MNPEIFWVGDEVVTRTGLLGVIVEVKYTKSTQYLVRGEYGEIWRYAFEICHVGLCGYLWGFAA